MCDDLNSEKNNSKVINFRNNECPKCGNENGLISQDSYPSRISCSCGNMWWGY